MRGPLIASLALLLAAGSPAGAAMLLGQNDNGHKQVVNTWSPQSGQSGRYTARIETRTYGATVATTMAAQPRAFILSATEADHKKVENGYAQ